MLKFCEEGPNPYLSCTKNNVFFSATSCKKKTPLGAAQTKIGPSYFVRALTYVIYSKVPIIVFQVNILPKLSNLLKKTMPIQKGFHHIVFKGQVFVAAEGGYSHKTEKLFYLGGSNSSRQCIFVASSLM